MQHYPPWLCYCQIQNEKTEHEICFTDCAWVQFYHLPSALKTSFLQILAYKALECSILELWRKNTDVWGNSHGSNLSETLPWFHRHEFKSGMRTNLLESCHARKMLEELGENRTDRCLAAWNFNTVGLILLKCEANKSWLALRIRLEATNSSKPLPETVPVMEQNGSGSGQQPGITAWKSSVDLDLNHSQALGKVEIYAFYKCRRLLGFVNGSWPISSSWQHFWVLLKSKWGMLRQLTHWQQQTKCEIRRIH